MIAECKQHFNMAAILTCLFKSFQWIPVLFINAVIVWSYYAYVLILCFGKSQNFVLFRHTEPQIGDFKSMKFGIVPSIFITWSLPV